MNLKEIRTKFVEITGRYDLVDDDINFVDNGADFYITEANKELYKNQDILPNNMEVAFTVPAGTVTLPIPNLITLQEMYYIDTAGNKKFITELSKNEFKHKYPASRRGALITTQLNPLATMAFAGSTITFSGFNPIAYGFLSGMSITIAGTASNDGTFIINSVTPTTIALTTAVSAEGAITANAAGFFGTAGSPEYARYLGLNISGQDIVQKGNIGIYFNVPFDSAVTLYVEGLFLDSLSDGADESYWSIKAPMLLLAQAAWFLEMTYRNTAGMRDWEIAILKQKEDLELQYSELTEDFISQMKESY